MAVKKLNKKTAASAKSATKKKSLAAKKVTVEKAKGTSPKKTSTKTNLKKAAVVVRKTKKSTPAKASAINKKTVTVKTKEVPAVKAVKKSVKLTKHATGKGRKTTSVKPVPLQKSSTAKKPIKKVASKKASADAIKATPAKKIIALPPMRTKKNDISRGRPESIPITAERSVLEKVAAVSLRYSDAELSEFREIINRRLVTAQHEMTYLQGLIVSKDGNESLGTRSGNAYDGDDPNEVEHISQLIERQIKFINNLSNALVRIENKTYGICRMTGKLIEKARLMAVPHATLSMEAKSTK
jgi:RNA polymerase-binding transcription factor DksA